MCQVIIHHGHNPWCRNAMFLHYLISMACISLQHTIHSFSFLTVLYRTAPNSTFIVTWRVSWMHSGKLVTKHIQTTEIWYTPTMHVHALLSGSSVCVPEQWYLKLDWQHASLSLHFKGLGLSLTERLLRNGKYNGIESSLIHHLSHLSHLMLNGPILAYSLIIYVYVATVTKPMYQFENWPIVTTTIP